MKYVTNNLISTKDDTRLLSWASDKTSRTCGTVATRKQIGPSMQHDGPVIDAIFNKDETRVLSWSKTKLSACGTLRGKVAIYSISPARLRRLTMTYRSYRLFMALGSTRRFANMTNVFRYPTDQTLPPNRHSVGSGRSPIVKITWKIKNESPVAGTALIFLTTGLANADQRDCKKQGDDCPCVKSCMVAADKCDPEFVMPRGQECSDKLIKCVRACGLK